MHCEDACHDRSIPPLGENVCTQAMGLVTGLAVSALLFESFWARYKI